MHDSVGKRVESEMKLEFPSHPPDEQSVCLVTMILDCPQKPHFSGFLCVALEASYMCCICDVSQVSFFFFRLIWSLAVLQPHITIHLNW